MTGYLHREYAESLREFGAPRELPRCGAWILERQIEGFPCRDAMGCYPLFACRDWSQLRWDLADIGAELVSLTLVTDPFGEFNIDDLRRCFDMVAPFKEHLVADLRQPLDHLVSKHHRKYSRKALKQVSVRVAPDPESYLDTWVDLYETLVERHNIRGIQRFSRESFEKQLSTPGMIMFLVESKDNIVGGNLFYSCNEVVYGHLSAFSPAGYELGAPYAVKWRALEYFAGKSHWLNLGGGAGIGNSKNDGLAQFKKGWCSDVRVTYLCGRIFDHERYEEIVDARGIYGTDYFPAYRVGEFG